MNIRLDFVDQLTYNVTTKSVKIGIRRKLMKPHYFYREKKLYTLCICSLTKNNLKLIYSIVISCAIFLI